MITKLLIAEFVKIWQRGNSIYINLNNKARYNKVARILRDPDTKSWVNIKIDNRLPKYSFYSLLGNKDFRELISETKNYANLPEPALKGWNQITWEGLTLFKAKGYVWQAIDLPDTTKVENKGEITLITRFGYIGLITPQGNFEAKINLRANIITKELKAAEAIKIFCSLYPNVLLKEEYLAYYNNFCSEKERLAEFYKQKFKVKSAVTLRRFGAYAKHFDIEYPTETLQVILTAIHFQTQN